MLSLDGFHGTAVVTRTPRGNFHAPIVNLVAKRLHGKNCKWFFELSGELFDSKQKDRNNCRCGDETNGVPSKLHGIVQGKRKEQQPNGQETGQMTSVKHGYWGCEQTFGTSQVVFKLSQVSVNLVLSHKMHGQIFNGVGKVLQGPVRTMGGGNNHFGLPLGQLFVQFRLEGGLVFFFGRQVTLHGPDKGPSTKRHRLEVVFPLFVADSRRVVIGIGHAIQIARSINVAPPVFTGFVPSSVGSIGAKDQEQSQRGTGQGKGGEGQGQFGQKADINDGFVGNAIKIRVATHVGIPNHNKGCHGDRGGHFSQQVAVDARLENGRDVKEETVRRPMLLPIIVRVDGSTKLSTGFPVGHGLGRLVAFKAGEGVKTGGRGVVAAHAQKGSSRSSATSDGR
mmetsp:Transcript_30041/g.82480  ORF Transcript_30041/g.82480 Transcript_30041/m.82480 type:complete len:394 (+) Transcript_30041:512-1693(+)